jgi:dihydroxyacetone kinase-like predicted kinase
MAATTIIREKSTCKPEHRRYKTVKGHRKSPAHKESNKELFRYCTVISVTLHKGNFSDKHKGSDGKERGI